MMSEFIIFVTVQTSKTADTLIRTPMKLAFLSVAAITCHGMSHNFKELIDGN